VQKLFRVTDTVVFAFDGDNAGRKAAWRALETTLPVLADGKNAQFLFLPDGEDPDDYVRQRGKAAFEALLAHSVPLSAFLLRELAARHPPTTAEGRAALVAAARPLVGVLTAPVLAALIRGELAALTGLPDAELRGLLRVPADHPGAPPSRAEPRNEPRMSRRGAPSSRRGPSLVRELIQGLLLQPEIARMMAIPRPDDGTADGAALSALVDFCARSDGPLTTPGTMQHFSGTEHERVLARALASASDHGITAEIALLHLRAGVQRYWLHLQRQGEGVAAGAESDAMALATSALPAEETERLRQLEMARRGFPSADPGGAPGSAS